MMKDFDRAKIEEQMKEYIPDDSIRSVLLDNYSSPRLDGYYFGVVDKLVELPCCCGIDGLRNMYVSIHNFYNVLSICDFEKYLGEIFFSLGRTLLRLYLYEDGYRTNSDADVCILYKEA